ncbi:DUF2993 domain-containing protein [Pleurocapsales cyanobacterium LEGE 10410]|nr:DUF2993 domain-containing protein [Pleurocapsales cyanobacterium LEGE 10410]
MNPKSEGNSDLKQTALDKVAEVAIANQIQTAKNIDVEVDSSVSQIVQGKVNSLKIKGEKVIAFKDIQLEEIDITCDNFAVDLTQVILGKISFDQPGNFNVKILFTESDCDRLLNSEYVRILLQNLSLETIRQSANFYIKETKCNLDNNGKLSLVATIVLNREQQVKTARFKIAFQFCQHGAAIKFDGGQYVGEQTLDLNETVAMMSKISDLLYLRHFSNADLSLDITGIDVEAQQLMITGDVQIKRLPDSVVESIESVASEVNHN